MPLNQANGRSGRGSERRNHDRSRGGRGRGRDHQKPRQETAKAPVKGLIEHLPVLVYRDPNKSNTNNYAEFKEPLRIYLEATFGKYGKFITDKKLWEPENPDLPTIRYNVKNRLSVSTWKAYDSAVERKDKQIEKFEDDKIKIFNVIMGQLSDPSKAQLKQFHGWRELLESNNPLELWNLIEATHLIPIASNDIVTVQSEAMNQYNQLRMPYSGTIDVFYEKFESCIDALESVKHPHVPEHAFQALDFADKLSNKYDDYKKHMKYEIASGILRAPTTAR